MPRGIPNNKMSINTNKPVEKQVITDNDVGNLETVVSNEQTESITMDTKVSEVAASVVTQEVPLVAPHDSNIFSYNWDITPLGDEFYNYTNHVTGASFDGSMEQFNKILKGK